MTISLDLDDDEALVLFELLSEGAVHSDDPCGPIVLDSLLCALEKKLVAPLDVRYVELLDAARRSLRKHLNS